MLGFSIKFEILTLQPEALAYWPCFHGLGFGLELET